MDAADNAGTFGGRGDGTVIMQLAVVLLEEEVDSVEIGGRTEGMSAAVVAGGATAGRRSRCRETDRVARGRDEEGLHLLLPRLVDRAGVSGRVLRVMMPLASPPQQELAPAPATPVERDDDGNGKVILCVLFFRFVVQLGFYLAKAFQGCRKVSITHIVICAHLLFDNDISDGL